VSQFEDLQEIYDFSVKWQQERKDRQISLEMSFYKETWMQMDRYNQMIESIPAGNTRISTILVDTMTLRKYLAGLPKMVIESIRSNVTDTMENETRSLREELQKTTEILDQQPASLNIYVEQVNTIKYIKEKADEFS